MWPHSERALFMGWGGVSPLIIPPCPLCSVTAKIFARYWQQQCCGQLSSWKWAEILWNGIKNHAAIQSLTWEVSKTFPPWRAEDEPHQWGIPKPVGYALTPAGPAFFLSHLLPPILPWHYWNGSKVLNTVKNTFCFVFPLELQKSWKMQVLWGREREGVNPCPDLIVSLASWSSEQEQLLKSATVFSIHD